MKFEDFKDDLLFTDTKHDNTIQHVYRFDNYWGVSVIKHAHGKYNVAVLVFSSNEERDYYIERNNDYNDGLFLYVSKETVMEIMDNVKNFPKRVDKSE